MTESEYDNMKVKPPIEPCAKEAVHIGSKYSSFSNPDDERFNPSKMRKKHIMMYWGGEIKDFQPIK